MMMDLTTSALGLLLNVFSQNKFAIGTYNTAHFAIKYSQNVSISKFSPVVESVIVPQDILRLFSPIRVINNPRTNNMTTIKMKRCE